MKRIIISALFLFGIHGLGSHFDVCEIKSVGSISAVKVMSLIGFAKYTSEFVGITSGLGPSQSLCVDLAIGASPADAITILSKSELPTVVAALLDITVNFGLYLVNDVTSIAADPSLLKTVKVTVGVHQTTGAVSVVVFEKTDGSYGDPPASTDVVDFKEYTVPATGTVLTQINNFIK